METVGERLKLIRKQNKLTQIEFADSLNISQGTLSEIESCKAKPSFDVLVLLSNTYSVNMNWLISNKNDELRFGLNKDEIDLLESFRELEDIAKEEVLEYLQMRLIRFRKKD